MRAQEIARSRHGHRFPDVLILSQLPDVDLGTHRRPVLGRVRKPPEARTQLLFAGFFTATLLAEGQDTLAPWTETIVQTLTQALATYQRKNMRNLYDALTMLAENIGPSIEDARYAGAILPGMLQKWENANKVDPELYHLLECLTAIIVGLGQASAEFSSGIFAKCISALTYQLQQRTAVQRGEMPAEEYAIDIVICTLDLLSGLCEGMGQAIEPLVAQSPIRDILIASCMDESPGVRRSAFALVGDLTRSSTAHLTPSLQQLMELIVAQLQPAMVISMNMSVCMRWLTYMRAWRRRCVHVCPVCASVCPRHATVHIQTERTASRPSLLAAERARTHASQSAHARTRARARQRACGQQRSRSARRQQRGAQDHGAQGAIATGHARETTHRDHARQQCHAQASYDRRARVPRGCQ